MMRAALWLLLPVMMAQTVPLEVRHGLQGGTLQFGMPGPSVPLVQEGAEWVCTFDVVYRVVNRAGQVLDEAKETIPVRLSAEQREAALAQPLAITRPLPVHPEAAEFRVEMTARPAGVRFAGALAVAAATFQAQAAVALVPFQVEGPGGKLVADLTAADIRVREDGAEVPATLQAVGRQGVPVDVTLLFGPSRSPGGGYGAEVFRKGLLAEFPNARVAIYGSSDRLVPLTGHTRDEGTLAAASAAAATMMPGPTAMYSNIEAAIQRFDQRRAAVRILAVFSEGSSGPGADRGTVASVMEAAQRAGVAIYPVLVVVQAPVRETRTANSKGQQSRPLGTTANAYGAGGFHALAESGGKMLRVLPGGNNLPGVLAEISKKLRDSYVASYQPSKGKREVKVELVDKKRGKVIGGVRTVVR